MNGKEVCGATFLKIFLTKLKVDSLNSARLESFPITQTKEQQGERGKEEKKVIYPKNLSFMKLTLAVPTLAPLRFGIFDPGNFSTAF